MKTLGGILAVLMLLVSANSVFAAHTGTLQSGEVSLSTSGGTPDPLIIGLSPKVTARYINPGTTQATAQWFAIATAHPGGNTVYGTAQNLNNIWQKGFKTGTALTTDLMNIPVSVNSADDWSNNGWKY
ncbi:hypothetical protein JCM30471_01310 [Desulfuromonas carbonis]|uniref:hypothetical protein n=1 Tax=Desulfuromonas sp. DDH964 TaxID=1823759 RepID=UPI0018D28C36|nr:hypothetical protein [Desulfuromonas sp. DDH964]